MRRRIAFIALTTATFLALTVQPALAIFRPGH
jgi:hypothetical protein